MQNLFSRSCVLAAGTVLLLVAVGCHRPPDKANLNGVAAPGNRPLAAYQEKLLSLAMDTATAIPVTPHIKDRSRAQEAVVTAYFELDQPQSALAGITKIDDWRRGAGYADYAFYCVRHGDLGEVPHYLDLANQIAEATEDWPRDCIRGKIAQTHVWLGQHRQAEEFARGVATAEAGNVARVKAMRCDEASFDAQVKAVDALVATGNFDNVRSGLETYIQFYGQFYRQVKRRQELEKKVKSGWCLLPVFIRIDLLADMAGKALDHADQGQALLLVDEARQMLDSHSLSMEEYVPLMAKLAALRFRSGEPRKAHADADALRIRYDAEEATVADVFRAGVLRPLAEAYQVMGDVPAALAVYRQAVEAGAHNPNSRPRAEDLSATCVSMAVHAVPPDPALWGRMRAIRTALADPW